MLSRLQTRLRRRLPVRPTAARHRRALSAWRRGTGVDRRPRPAYVRVLLALSRASDPLRSGTVAVVAGRMTSSHASAHLNRGVDRTHVERCGGKKRRVLYALTPSGRQYLLEHDLR